MVHPTTPFKPVQPKGKIMLDSMVSKKEWQKYCGQLKQVNTELGKLAMQQHHDLREITAMADLPWWSWLLYFLGIKKDLLTILKKYRDGDVKEIKKEGSPDAEDEERTAEQPTAEDVAVAP